MALGWLVLPMEMAGVDHSVPLIPAEQFVAASTSAPGGAAPDGGGTSTGDLVLPVVAVGAAGLLAVYAQVRRRRRMRTRTTPGGTSVGAASVEEIEARARRSLVETDDSVRTSAEELRAAAAQLGDTAVRPFRAALEYAESELAAAFRLRHRLDDSVAGGGADTRGMLEEIVARCAEAGRRLDAEAAAFDQTRSLERQAPAVLERTEARFRELTVRASAADTTLAELHERYAPSAVVPVAGHVEQAKDRLVFATSSLNRARQALDRGETERAVVLLRAAEGPSTRPRPSWTASRGSPRSWPPRRRDCPPRWPGRRPASWRHAAARTAGPAPGRICRGGSPAARRWWRRCAGRCPRGCTTRSAPSAGSSRRTRAWTSPGTTNPTTTRPSSAWTTPA
ncbi:hypothetical protein SAV31267_062830 [Streptomyces avermitilis]|uniref:TPM domain-containing protein n=1 Tax=Streptomyces avermitilis TaxID=33903 RepID=A0A4D4MX97_STRAX|nr:hypothetical protein SAV31267_062830 [Streptomyces avermitilis]